MFFHYNEHLGAHGEIEPITRLIVTHQPVSNRPGVYKAVHQLMHPLQNEAERVFHEHMSRTSLGEPSSTSQAATIGEHISLKLLPAVIYLTIHKSVEMYALQILAKQLIRHANQAPTRILLKFNKHGKYSYNTWISTKVMSELDDQQLFEKLKQITSEGRVAKTLVIKQKIRKGFIHELWEQQHSLL